MFFLDLSIVSYRLHQWMEFGPLSWRLSVVLTCHEITTELSPWQLSKPRLLMNTMKCS